MTFTRRIAYMMRIAGACAALLLLVCGCDTFAPAPDGGGGFGAPLPPPVVADIFGTAGGANRFSPDAVRVDTADGEQTWTDLTDLNGEYRLVDVTAGARAVSFSLPGHETAWRLVELGSEDVRVDVELVETEMPDPTGCPHVDLDPIEVNNATGMATVSGIVDHVDSGTVALLHNGQAQLVEAQVAPAQGGNRFGGAYPILISVQVPLTDGTNTFAVMASNAVCSLVSDEVSVEYGAFARGNTPPVIDTLEPDRIGVGQRGVAQLHCGAHDNDGDALLYTWTATGGSIGGLGPDTTWGSDPTPGWYTITCVVRDGRGGSATATVQVRTLGGPNIAPVIDSLTVYPERTGYRGIGQTTCVAHDDDGDPLFYSWTATGGVIGGSDSEAVWLSAPASGFYTITCTVTDGVDTVTADVQIEVM